MPVLKRQQAAPKIKDAIVLDLGDVSRQAERMRAKAREDAERIVKEAEQRARQLIDGAEEQGRAQGHEAGHAQGLAEGREQGRAEALQQMQQQLEQFESSWSDLAQQWQQQRAQIERDARRNVIEFALKVAERVVHRQVELDESVVVDQVAGALSHVLRPLDVTVRIHPKDRALVDEALPRLSREFHQVQHIELADDEAIGRGGCALRFGQGEVDATLQTQIERIVEAMLPRDVSSAQPSAHDTDTESPAASDASADEQPGANNDQP